MKTLRFPPAAGTYDVFVSRVIDADTFEVCFLIPVKIRLARVNAAELTTEKGKRAAADLKPMVEGRVCQIDVRGLDKFGRVEADIREPSGQDVAQFLVDHGYAVPWDAKGPKPLPMTALGPIEDTDC